MPLCFAPRPLLPLLKIHWGPTQAFLHQLSSFLFLQSRRHPLWCPRGALFFLCTLSHAFSFRFGAFPLDSTDTSKTGLVSVCRVFITRRGFLHRETYVSTDPIHNTCVMSSHDLARMFFFMSLNCTHPFGGEAARSVPRWTLQDSQCTSALQWACLFLSIPIGIDSPGKTCHKDSPWLQDNSPTPSSSPDVLPVSYALHFRPDPSEVVHLLFQSRFFLPNAQDWWERRTKRRQICGFFAVNLWPRLVSTLGLQPPPEKMVGVGFGGWSPRANLRCLRVNIGGVANVVDRASWTCPDNPWPMVGKHSTHGGLGWIQWFQS